MEEIDVQHYVLPALLTLLFLGTFLVIVTSGGGEESGAVDRPARSGATTTTKSRTTATTKSRTATTQTVPASSGRFVKVQPGDTPTSIADRSGISVERLLELNPSVDPGALKPGQTLKLAP
ncbi:MAG: LysM domain-containing protein [Solirubrobacteraceae bacterium]|nr:LysM domain-containing protein [Solirubrobacteraceae bacterium]